jgi:hypothetical protein
MAFTCTLLAYDITAVPIDGMKGANKVVPPACRILSRISQDIYTPLAQALQAALDMSCCIHIYVMYSEAAYLRASDHVHCTS